MVAVQTEMLGGLPDTVLRDAMFTHPTAAEAFEATSEGGSSQPRCRGSG